MVHPDSTVHKPEKGLKSSLRASKRHFPSELWRGGLSQHTHSYCSLGYRLSSASGYQEQNKPHHFHKEHGLRLTSFSYTNKSSSTPPQSCVSFYSTKLSRGGPKNQAFKITGNSTPSCDASKRFQCSSLDQGLEGSS